MSTLIENCIVISYGSPFGLEVRDDGTDFVIVANYDDYNALPDYMMKAFAKYNGVSLRVYRDAIESALVAVKKINELTCYDRQIHSQAHIAKVAQFLSHLFYTDDYRDFDEFNRLLDEAVLSFSIVGKTKQARSMALKSRRKDFAKDRPDLLLKMLSAGQVMRCCVIGCAEIDHITVDHKIPISRGGTDDISNLQFMCRSHNSMKSDKLETEVAS